MSVDADVDAACAISIADVERMLVRFARRSNMAGQKFASDSSRLLLSFHAK